VSTNELLHALHAAGINLALGVDGVLRTVCPATGERVVPPPAIDAALRTHAATLKAVLAGFEGDIEYCQLAAAVAAATLPPAPPYTTRRYQP